MIIPYNYVEVKSANKELGAVKWNSLTDLATLALEVFPNLAGGVYDTWKIFKSGQGVLATVKSGFYGLWGVIKAHPLITIAAAVATAIAIFDNYNKRIEENEKKVSEASEKLKEQKDSISNHAKTVKAISKEYEDLSKGVNAYGENVSLTSAQYERYIELSNEIAGMYPSLVKSYDEQGNAILKCKGNVESLTNALKDEQEEFYASFFSEEAEDNWHAAAELISSDQGFLGEYNHTYSAKKNKAEELKTILMAARTNSTDYEARFQFEEDSVALIDALNDIGYDFSKNGGFYDWISSSGYIKITQDEMDNIISELDIYIRDQNNAIENAIQSTLTPRLDAFLHYKNSEYNSYPEETKQLLDEIVSSLSYDNFYSQFEGDDLYDINKVQEAFISQIVNPLKKNPLAGKQFRQVVDAQTKFVSGDIGSKELLEAQNKLSRILDKMGIDYSTKKLFLSIAFDNVEIADGVDVKDAIDNIATRVSGEDAVASNGIPSQKHAEIESYLNSVNLTQSQLKILYEDSNIAGYSLEELQERIKEIKDGTKEEIRLNITFEDATKEVDKAFAAFDSVKKVISDYNENGALSYENVKALISMDGKYVDALVNEQGELDLTSEKFKELAKAQLLQLEATLLQDTLNKVNSLETEADALNYLRGCQEKETLSVLDLADAEWNEALASAAAKDAKQGTGDLFQRAVLMARSSFKKVSAATDIYRDSLDNLNSISDNSVKALEKQKKALEKQKKALDKQKDGYDEAIDGIKDLIEWTEKYIKQLKEDEKEALEKQKDELDELIDKKKELLNIEREEADFNKEIAEKQNTVASNALAAATAELDNSSAGRKANKEANDALSESRGELKDYLYEKDIENRQKNLDKLKEESDKHYDEQIKVISDYLSDDVQLYKDACEMIDNDHGELYGNLLWYCKKYTTTTESEFNHMWNSAQTAMSKYNTANIPTFDLMNQLQGRMCEVDDAIKSISKSIDSYSDKIDSVKSNLDKIGDSAQSAIEKVKLASNTEDEWYEKHKFKYQFVYNGVPFYTSESDKNKAAADLANRARAFGVPIDAVNTIYKKMKPVPKYAKGTKSAKGGLSIVDEEKIGSELIPIQVGSGRYTILPEGNPVFSKDMTNELFNFSSNPKTYLDTLVKKQESIPLIMSTNTYYHDFNENFKPFSYVNYIDRNADRLAYQLTNNTLQNINNTKIDVNTYIQGDATQTTVRALEQKEEDIIKRATESVMNVALKNRKLV